MALGKLVSFVFPRVLMFPSTSSRETSGLSGKQNCFPRDHTLSVYYLSYQPPDNLEPFSLCITVTTTTVRAFPKLKM